MFKELIKNNVKESSSNLLKNIIDKKLIDKKLSITSGRTKMVTPAKC